MGWSKSTAVRYERDKPGELVHMDVEKLGKIPDGGGWRALGRAGTRAAKAKRAKIGYDFVHWLVDDHARLAYCEILPDEKCGTCPALLRRAADYFASKGIARIERVMTDSTFAYRHGAAVKEVCAQLGATQKFHQATLHLAEREGRTTQPQLGLPASFHPQRRPRSSPCTLGRALHH